jgi:hypothetical protein
MQHIKIDEDRCFLITGWDGREQTGGSSHEEIGTDSPLSESDSIRDASNESSKASIPTHNMEIGDSDSGSSNAEKYAGSPVKQYVRAFRERRIKSLTLHSVVTPQQGGLAYQREKGMVGGEV